MRSGLHPAATAAPPARAKVAAALVEALTLPPHCVEAEEAVLGCMLGSPAACGWALEHVTAEDLYRPAHRTVFQVISELAAVGEAVDAITVLHALRRHRQLADVGGAPFLHTLVQAPPTFANVAHYARIVIEAAARRRVMDLGARLIVGAASPDTDPATVAAEIRAALERLEAGER
jgi:replicative DNA helicase